jgi:hypothetical protein
MNKVLLKRDVCSAVAQGAEPNDEPPSAEVEATDYRERQIEVSNNGIAEGVEWCSGGDRREPPAFATMLPFEVVVASSILKLSG